MMMKKGSRLCSDAAGAVVFAFHEWLSGVSFSAFCMFSVWTPLRICEWLLFLFLY